MSARTKARKRAVDLLFESFFGLTAWLVGLALLAAAVLLVTGPSAWATRVRAAVGSGARSARSAGTTVRAPALAALGANRDLALVAGVAVAVVLLLLLDLNLWGLLIVVALLGGWVLLVLRQAEAEEVDATG